jgi:hypothetical protein
MSNRRLLLSGFAAVVACIAAVVVAMNYRADRYALQQGPAPQPDPVEPEAVAPRAYPTPAWAVTQPAEPSTTAPAGPPVVLRASEKQALPAEKKAPKAESPKKSPPVDPAAAEAAAVARRALFYVGADPDAEAVWVDAINDPSRTAHERSDLIEDLNEEGFPDPKHPSPDDLPLIENRLALIEDLAPDAMDEVNAAAFAEAYKDLANMYARVTEQ